MHKGKGHDKKEPVHHRPKVQHHKRVSSDSPSKPHGRLEDQIAHSLIELQKVHVNLAEKYDKLSNNIANLLSLFELAARNFAKQPHMQNTERDKEFLDKIDKLLDQNKLLAKGLTLMEDNMRERLYGLPSSGSVSLPSSNLDQSEMRHGLKTQLEEV